MPIISWLNRRGIGVVNWLREGRVGWLALIIGVLVFVGTDWLPLQIERRVALAGMLFQLIGVGVSAFVFGRLRRYFKFDPVLKSLFKYLGDVRYIFISRPPVHATATTRFGVMTQLATGRVYAPPTGTPEERLARVEEQVRNLQGALDTTRNQLERKLIDAVAQETSARDKGFTKVDDKLKETLVGDWQFAFVGLMYLFVGIILGTIPEVVAQRLLFLGFSP